MSVAILIEFRDPAREALYLPLAAQGAYGGEWVPAARKLGLRWLPLFLTGTTVSVEDLADVAEELQRLRASLAGDPRSAATVERIDFVLERLHSVDLCAVAEVFIG